jgi:hypothetical protein
MAINGHCPLPLPSLPLPSSPYIGRARAPTSPFAPLRAPLLSSALAVDESPPPPR